MCDLRRRDAPPLSQLPNSVQLDFRGRVRVLRDEAAGEPDVRRRDSEGKSLIVFRRRYRFVSQYRQAGKGLEAQSRLRSIERDRGWAESRMFTPTPGVL